MCPEAQGVLKWAAVCSNLRSVNLEGGVLSETIKQDFRFAVFKVVAVYTRERGTREDNVGPEDHSNVEFLVTSTETEATLLQVSLE